MTKCGEQRRTEYERHKRRTAGGNPADKQDHERFPIMENSRFNLAGATCFWTLGEETDFTKFDAELRAAGFSKFAPEKPTDFAALRDILYADFGSDHVYSVKNQAQPTFEVVSVRPAAGQDTLGRNDYGHKLTARVTTAGNIETDTGDAATDDRLTHLFRTKRNQVSYHALSRCLVDIVYHLNGTTLRPSGGIYFLPNAAFERWEMIANAVEQSGPKNRCFAMRMVMDEHAAAAIREALTAEIEREAKEIDAAFHNPELGIRAKATQSEHARQLRRKIETYEQTFELMLPDLKRQLDQATGREAIGNLIETASFSPMLTDDTPPTTCNPLHFAFA